MLNKILLTFFAVLLLVVVGESTYYFAIQRKIMGQASSKGSKSSDLAPITPPVCKTLQQLAKVDAELSKIRTQLPEYYLVDRSFVNLYSLAAKDPGQRIYSIMEKVGIIQKLQLDIGKSPLVYCFSLINGTLSDDYCLSKKDVVVFNEDTSKNQNVVSYSTLKNNDNVRLIVKDDMGKPDNDSHIETKLQIPNRP